MRKKRKKIGLLFILTVYILLSPENEGGVLKFLPDWIIDIDDKVTDNSAGKEAIPFKLGSVFGYFDKKGRLTLKDRVFYGLTQTDDYYINYSSIADQIVLNSSKGEFLKGIKTSGYPYFLKDRLFLISTNRKKISEVTVDGDLLWEDENLSEITSIDASADNVITGYVNGDVVIADSGKKVEKLFKPDLSRINTVYGVGISDDSEYISVISGIEPQYMLLFRKKHGEYSRIFSYQFVKDLRFSRIIGFTEDSRYLYFGSTNTFYCYNLEKRKLDRISVGEKLIKVLYYKKEDVFCILSTGEKANNYRVTVTYSDGRILFENSFDAEDVYFDMAEENLFIGADEKIYSVKLNMEIK